MKGSLIIPGSDTDYNDTRSCYEFDPKADFSQFLEEARRYANGNEEMQGENGHKDQSNTEKQSKKKKKKSWKTALFSFWKTTEKKKKKSKQCSKESSSMGSHFANPKPRGYVSGPIYRNRWPGVAHWVPASGPLISLFHPKKREESSMLTPYVSLEKPNKMQYGAKAYGPLYLVS